MPLSAVAPTQPVSDPYAGLADVLWEEREVLERLLYALVQQHLLLAAGRARWMNRADAQVRAAVADLRTGEVLRAAEVQALAADVGLEPAATLADLAAAAPEPWPVLLAEHRQAMRALVGEIETTAAENRRLLHAGARAIRETLDRLGAAVCGFAAANLDSAAAHADADTEPDPGA